jgi:acetyl esterase/lipase
MTDPLSTDPLSTPGPGDPGIPPFFPPEVRAVHPQRAESYVGLTYAVEPGWRHLHLDLHVPVDRRGPVPLVIWVHGGAWLFGVRDLLPPEWPPGIIVQSAIDAGFAVATIEYRHSREAAFPAQLHDAKAAIRYLRVFAGALGVDTARMALWGESAGGHLAALAALIRDPALEGSIGLPGPSSEVAAVVCFYPVTDVEAMPSFNDALPPEVRDEIIRATGSLPPEPIDVLIEHSPYPRDEARRLLSPVHHVRADAPPFLLIHGDADRVVPAEQSVLFADALRSVGAHVEHETVAGADHVFAGADPLPPIARAIAFLRAQLGG